VFETKLEIHDDVLLTDFDVASLSYIYFKLQATTPWPGLDFVKKVPI